MLRYPHLFFDLDHTLWDFELNKNTVLQLLWEEEVSRRTTASFAQFQEAFDRHNEVLWARFRLGTISRAELRTKRFARALLDLKIPQQGLEERLSIQFLEMLPKQTALLPYALAMVQHCAKKGHHLYVITNGFEVTQRAKIEGAGLGGFFKEVFSSEGCGYPKPHRAIFEAAQHFARALPAECLMIGDTLEADICGAQRAGWHQVYYNPAQTAHQEAPTYEITCLSALREVLDT
jgi:putative hydrolase of the HAD superfamily